MADLRSRVGRRFFPNQSWIKPGYEPPKRSALNKSSPEGVDREGEPELYSLGASRRAATSSPMRIKYGNRSSSTSWLSSSPTKPYVSLLERIQMEPNGGGEIDMDAGGENKQAKSLLDRLECPLDGATSSTAAAAVTPPAAVDNNGRKVNSDGDSRTDTLPTLPNHPALIGQSVSASEHPVNISYGQLKGQDNTLFSRVAYRTRKGGSSSGTTGHSQSRSPAATSPPSSGIPSPSKGDIASTSGRGDRDSPSSQPISRDSTSSMTAAEFLNHILPLTQRIAQGRADETEAGNSTSAAEIDSSVVTEETIKEFNKNLLNLRNDLEQHDDEELKKNGMTVDSRHANESRSQDTVLISIRSPHPMSPPIQPQQVEIAPEMELEAIFARPSNQEIPMPIPDATKTDSTPVTPASSSKRSHSHSEHRYHSRKSYSPEQRRRGDHKRRKDWHHDDKYYYDDKYHRSSKGKELRRSISPYRWHYTSPKRTRKDSHSLKEYRPTYHRSRSRGRLRGRSRSRSPHRSRERGRHHHTDRSYRDSDSGRSERLAPDSVASSSSQRRPILISPQNESHKDINAVSAKHAEPRPPCHNVPGLWFSQQGLHQLGISIVEFEIDEVTATQWNIRSEGETRTNETSSDTGATPHMKLSLELCCLAFCDVQTTLQKLGKAVTSHELVQALSTLKKTWPPQGNFIVAINPERPGGRFWLPNVLSQTESPLQLEQYVHKGNNIVKFIQLSGLSEQTFILLATAVEKKGFRDDCSKLKFIFPEESTGINFQAPILSVDSM